MKALKAISKAKYILKASRPSHWSKNLLVFAAPLFSFQIKPSIWLPATGALVSFCLISSAVYLINDCLDYETDRNHPRKQYRPIAAGLISKSEAVKAAIIFASLSFYFGTIINPSLLLILISYSVIQIAYCLKLKQEPLIDLFCISSGFLLRAIAGGVCSGLKISPWFLLTIGLLALFLALEKRKAELRNPVAEIKNRRKVLERYSMPLLLRLESLVATSSFVTYSLWSAGPALQGAQTSWMLATVPFVLIGIFRYQLLSDPAEASRRESINSNCRTTENPEEILLNDKGIQFTLMGWLVTTVIIGLKTVLMN